MAKRANGNASPDFSFDTGTGNATEQPTDPASIIGAPGSDSSGEQFDPATHGVKADGSPSRNADGSFRRKRGAGATRKANTSSAPPLSIEPIKNLLLQIHVGLAQATKAPELALYDMEAENLGAAIVHLSAQYGGKIDPKAEAWLRMTIVAASVYGPRVIAVRNRQAKERAERRPKPQVSTPTEVPHPFAVEQVAPNAVS